MRVYYDRKKFFEIHPDDMIELTAKKYVIINKGKYCINYEHPEIKYLTSPKIQNFKRMIYIEHIIKKKFVCEDCGKKNSFQIRPVVEKNGSINFKKIANVCVECRHEFLNSRDLLTPQFKKPINWAKEKEKALEVMKDKEISDRNRYFKLSMEIVKIEKFIKLVLPPLKEKKELYDIVLDDFRDVIKKHLGDDIDLDQYLNRRIVRDYLIMESNGHCIVCGRKHSFITIDHIIAKDLGGKNHIDNFIGMCIDCNKIKDNKSVIEFLSVVELSKIPTRVLTEAYKQQEELKILLESLYQEREALIYVDEQ